jgi:hypothetical protein
MARQQRSQFDSNVHFLFFLVESLFSKCDFPAARAGIGAARPVCNPQYMLESMMAADAAAAQMRMDGRGNQGTVV